jgi:hypothetical protein
MRGEYVKLTAEMFHRGVPADPWSAGLLRRREVRQAVRLRAVSDTSLTQGLYQGSTLAQLQIREFLVHHKVKGWRKTTKGLGRSGNDFERLEEQHPEFKGLADIHETITQLHELQLFRRRRRARPNPDLGVFDTRGRRRTEPPIHSQRRRGAVTR